MSDCPQGFVPKTNFKFIEDCDVPQPDINSVINCQITVPPPDPPPLLAPCGEIALAATSTLEVLPPAPGLPTITGSATTTTTRDCVTCQSEVLLDLNIKLPKLLSFVTFRTLERFTPNDPCGRSNVVYNYDGVWVIGEEIQVCYPRGVPTDRLYIPVGAYGVAIASGDDDTYQIVSVEKPALLVKARLVASYGAGTLACNMSTILVTALEPLQSRDDSFFPFAFTDTIRVSNQMQLEGSPNDQVMLTFDRTLTNRTDIEHYFVSAVYPACNTPGVPLAPLVIPP